jgi:malonyl CoA-acyl carrier protein transacylase
MFTDKEAKLGQTENTQPVLLTHSSALLNALNVAYFLFGLTLLLYL